MRNLLPLQKKQNPFRSRLKGFFVAPPIKDFASRSGLSPLKWAGEIRKVQSVLSKMDNAFGYGGGTSKKGNSINLFQYNKANLAEARKTALQIEQDLLKDVSISRFTAINLQ